MPSQPRYSDQNAAKRSVAHLDWQLGCLAVGTEAPLQRATLPILGLAILQVVLWRWAPGAWVLSLTGLIVILAALMSFGTSRGYGLAIFSLGAAAVSTLVAHPSLWPCEVACSGAIHYRSLGPLPTWAWAALAYTAIGILGLAQPRTYALATLTRGAAWGCVGASIYFLILSWRLDMLCSHCLAVHGIVLCFPAVLGGHSPAWPQRWLIMLVAALGLHAAFHPGPHQALAEPVDVDHQQREAFEALLRQRVIGSEQAPWQGDLVLDLQCQHCKAAWSQLAPALSGPIAAGTLRLNLRLRWSPSLKDSQWLAQLASAAAINNEYWATVDQLLDSPLGMSIDNLRQRLAVTSNLNINELETKAAAQTELIKLLMQHDLQWLSARDLSYTATPIVALRHQDGASHRFNGEFSVADITAVIEP